MQNDDFVKDENQVSGGDAPDNLSGEEAIVTNSNDEQNNVSNEVNDNLKNVNITDVNNGEVNTNKGGEKNKKVLIIVGIIIAIIILAIIVAFVYIKFKFTAPNYIDEKVEDFTTSVDEMFAGYSLNAKSDSLLTGDFTFNTDVSELVSLNGLNVNFNVGYSATKEIIDMNFELLNKDSSLLTAEAYIDDSAVYFNSEDLYSQTLYATLEDNPFAEVNSEEYQVMMDINNYKEFIINFVKYFGTALKEADVNSSINGLTAIYTYDLNDNNKEAFASKLNDLIDNDTTMKEFLQVMLDTESVSVNPENIPNMTLEVVVKIPSGDLKSFELTTDDMVINASESENNVYDVKIDNVSVMTVTVDGDNVQLVSEDETSSFDITFNTKDYTMDGTIAIDETSVDIAITNSDDNTKNIILEMETIDDYYDTSSNMAINYVITNVSDSETNMNGTVNISSDNVSMGIEFDVNSQIGDDLVSEKTFSNLKDIDTLTSDDENEITNNLMNILGGIAPEISEDLDREIFFTNAQINVNTAAYSIYSGACITFDELGGEGVVGKVEGDTQGYRVSITDGEYMILDKYLYFGEEISEEDIELYDSSRFTEEYYTCLAS